MLLDAHNLLELCSTNHFIILKNYAIMLPSVEIIGLVLLELSDVSSPESSASLEIVVALVRLPSDAD